MEKYDSIWAECSSASLCFQSFGDGRFQFRQCGEGMLKYTKQQYYHPLVPPLSKEEVLIKSPTKTLLQLGVYSFIKPSSNKVAVGG